MSKPKLPKMIYVEWIDSCGTFGWQGELAPASWCYTIGWFVSEDDDQIRIAESYDPAPNNATWMNGVTIPKVAIRKRKWVKL